MSVIAAAIAGVKLGIPQAHRNLTIFPLLGEDDQAAPYMLLDDALKEKKAEVSEVSQHGRVPNLAFENKTESGVLLVEGDELRGAKQNRILNLTIFVGPGVKIEIPVSCVEQGRWNYNSSHFGTKFKALFASARAQNYESVSHSLRASNSAVGDQGKVWANVGAKLQSTHTFSGTSSMSDAYDKMEKDLKPYEQAFEAVDGQRGAVVCIDGRPVGMELFDSAAAFKQYLGKLVNSYALDAVETADEGKLTAVSDAAVEGFLGQVAAAQADKFDTVGLGESLRWTGGVTGGARVVDGKVVHLASFLH